MKVTDTFDVDKDNSKISYADYYMKQWKLEIKDKNQFLIKTLDKKSKRALYLIPEFCFMTGLTDKMRADFNLNKDIATTTKCPPSERMKNTQQLIQLLNDPNNDKSFKCFKEWNIALKEEPM
jgi:aubergine